MIAPRLPTLTPSFLLTRTLFVMLLLGSMIGCSTTDVAQDTVKTVTDTNLPPVTTPVATPAVGSETETIVLEQAQQESTVPANLIPQAQPGFAPGAQQTSAACLDMAKQLDALSGKPLRRSALEERYQAECKR